MKKRVMMAMVVAMGVAVPAFAATTIGYAGQLRDAEGKALTELNQRITFALYNTPSGGEALWKAERNVVLSPEGYFNVELEDDNPSVSEPLEEVLQKNSTLYIGLTPKGAAAEIAPRQRILESPHAAVASAAKTGVDGFKVSGTAMVTTLAATTVNVTNVIATTSVTAPIVKAGNVKQQYAVGTKVKYGDLLPKGVVVMWNGAADSIPDGWALCNGQDGTPDLRGRFVVGYDPRDRDYSAVGSKGGEKTHKLTVDEMPAHNHETLIWSWNEKAEWKSGSCILTAYKVEEESTQYCGKSDSKGGDQAHENRPPYYALCYIIKL